LEDSDDEGVSHPLIGTKRIKKKTADDEEWVAVENKQRSKYNGWLPRIYG
jgi:hypothetical protein